MIARTMLLLAAACLSACGSTTPVMTAEQAAGSGDDIEYRIGSGDTLTVTVFNHPELSAALPVRPDGKISTPLVEDIVAAGRTPTQLSRDIEGRLAEYVRSPRVSVMVSSFTGTMADGVRVVGQATKPQAIPFRANMSVLDVMIQVGGLAEFAAGNRARIVRNVDGKQVQIPVRLNDLLNDGDISANVQMKPGDVLIIPESRF